MEERNCEYCNKLFTPKRSKAKYCSESHRNLAYQKRMRDGQTSGGLTMRAKIDIIFNKMQELSMPILKDAPKVNPVGTVFQESVYKPSPPIIPQIVSPEMVLRKYTAELNDCWEDADFKAVWDKINADQNVTPRIKQQLLNYRKQ